VSPAEIIAWLLVMLAGLAGSALFSGLETGVYSLSRVRLELAARHGADGRAARGPIRLLREIDRPESLLTTILVGNNACNYLGTLGLGTLLIAAGVRPTAAVLIQTLALTPVLVIFGESLPKELFRLRADTLPARGSG
jgi:Mg2+/Co2+ transporter CorB